MGGGTGGNNGIATIPAGSRKVVQSLREIVDCPEQEIYAALRDCNMDPNEAVNRLLSQDPFHEVKSKREKKKENKDTTDSRARSNTSNRGGRTGIDRYPGRSRASASTTTESTGFHGKPAYKDIDSHAYGGSSSVASGNSGNRQSLPVSDPVIVESKVLTVGETDAFPGSSSQPSSGFQPAWFGMPGQVSMADIVKKGRPQSNVSGLLNPINCSNQQRVAPSVSTTHSDFHPLPVHQSSSSRNAHANDDFPLHEQQNPANDEWPQFEHSQGPVSSVLEPRDIPLNGGGQYLDEKHQFSDERPLETNTTHNVGSSVSSKNVQDGESEAFVQHHLHVYEQNEDEGIAANMQQQLSLEKEEEEEDVSTEDDGPAVVIPDHLQVHVTDCQHLSFGSFGSIAATFGGLTSSRHFQDDPTEAPTTSDNASISQVDISDQEQYGEENRRPASSDVDNVHGTGTSITNYETAPVPETEVFQKDGPKSGPGNQYAFASSGPGYDYDSRQALGAAFSHTQTSSQMQNLASYSNVLPTAYSSSLPSALLQTSDHTGRETDLTYLPFNVTQSMPTKFSNPASSISSASVETFRETDISTPQQQQFQNLPPASLATGPALSQHLAMHPYSQPTLPLGHFANMVSYPFLPQNYSYMPSAFQQAFAGNSTYHQSLAAASVLPQYKNSLSVSSLPQSGAAVPAGYGYGSSNNIPGTNFPLNQSVAPVGTNIGYDDALNSHYKEAAQLLSIQQNENSAMWMHGLGSRTMQPNNYYNYNQGQSQQQTGGFRQVQNPSQHYGGLGYPNFYQSSGMSLEQQQQQQQHQMVRGDVSLNGPQVQQPKQSPQLWQNNY